MIRPELAVPEPDKALRQSGISSSGFDSVFAMIEMISGVYKSGVLFAHI